MLALGTILFAPVLAAGQVFGTPVTGAVAPAGVSVLLGAFVFAIGMQLAGGCGSGTLYQVGAGSPPLAITLLFFVVGSVLASFHMHFWAAMPSLGEVTLGEHLGWGTAVAVQLAVCGLLGTVRSVSAARLAVAVVGGLLLGYGARIAFGCSIGALFSGIASTSLHGWLWGAAALAGTPVGVRLRSIFGLDR